MGIYFNVFAAVFTALFGIWAFLKPHTAAKLVGLQAKGKRGLSDIRSIYGGFNIGLGAFAAWCQSVEVFQMLAVAYFAAAICRTISLAMDKAFSKMGLRFIIGEILIGLCFLA